MCQVIGKAAEPGTGDRFDKIVLGVHPAAVFRRTPALAVKAYWGPHLAGRRQSLFYDNLMLPGIAEIVGIAGLSTLAAEHFE